MISRRRVRALRAPISVVLALGGLPLAAPPLAAQGDDVSVGGISPRSTDFKATIAVNPADPRKVLVVAKKEGFKECVYYRSTDRGDTWNVAKILPLEPHTQHGCRGPVVRASPDGRFFYVAYAAQDEGNELFIPSQRNALTLYRFGGDLASGKSVSVVWRDLGRQFTDPSIDVHKFADSHKARRAVYVTATETTQLKTNDPRTCNIVFSRSLDGGSTWSPRTRLTTGAFSSTSCNVFSSSTTGNRIVGGSRVTGGASGDVLACWYDSAGTTPEGEVADDGWGARPGGTGGGSFSIRCRASDDFGAFFGPTVTVVTDTGELPDRLCPTTTSQDIGTSMFPRLAVGPDGSAHITYTVDPSLSGDAECGDIRYVRSADPVAGQWDAAVTLGADGMQPQYSPALSATYGRDGDCSLHLAYLSHPFPGVGEPPNSKYDILATQSSDCGATWGPSEKLNDSVSFTRANVVLGHRVEIATAPGARRAFVLWLNRPSTTHFEDIFVDKDAAA